MFEIDGAAFEQLQQTFARRENACQKQAVESLQVLSLRAVSALIFLGSAEHNNVNDTAHFPMPYLPTSVTEKILAQLAPGCLQAMPYRSIYELVRHSGVQNLWLHGLGAGAPVLALASCKASTLTLDESTLQASELCAIVSGVASGGCLERLSMSNASNVGNFVRFFLSVSLCVCVPAYMSVCAGVRELSVKMRHVHLYELRFFVCVIV